MTILVQPSNPHALFEGNDDFIIRYVHINESGEFEGRQVNGITIAYVRDDERVYFAATICNRHDTYTKSIGRQYSSKLLREAMEYMQSLPTEKGAIKSRLGTGIIGLIDMDYILSILGPVLSIQAESSLTPMDFRHVFLSHCLYRAVLSDE